MEEKRIKILPYDTFTYDEDKVKRVILHYDGNGTLIPRDHYLRNCERGGFIDYDGYGSPVDSECYVLGDDCIPSNKGSDLPDECTHVVWYNR